GPGPRSGGREPARIGDSRLGIAGSQRFCLARGVARQPSHRRSSGFRSDEQGFEPRGAALSSLACRIAALQTATVAGSPAQATGAYSSAGCIGESVRYLILVVEDNLMNRELLCDWLEAEGHEVQSAEDLPSARRLLKDRRP